MSVSLLTSYQLPEQEADCHCAFCNEPWPGNEVWACLRTRTSKCDETWGNNRENNDNELRTGDVMVVMDWIDQKFICLPCMEHLTSNLTRLSYPRHSTWTIMQTDDKGDNVKTFGQLGSEEEVIAWLQENIVKGYDEEAKQLDDMIDNSVEAGFLKNVAEGTKKFTTAAEYMKYFDYFHWGRDNRRTIYILKDGKEI